MKPGLQAKLLRVLQTKEFERLGSNKTISIDFRLISATNQDLEKAVENKNFRNDLFYRINEYPIYLPPLRERLNDIEELVIHFVKKVCSEINRGAPAIDASFFEMVKKHKWKGNIRELENMIRKVVITLKSKKVIAWNAKAYNSAINTLVSNIISTGLSLKEIENAILKRALTISENSVTKAVRRTGIARDRFYRHRQYCKSKEVCCTLRYKFRINFTHRLFLSSDSVARVVRNTGSPWGKYYRSN